ncbi:MAG: NAD-dependent epimerase/dehydratase family protein, partial [Verrucomicrobia bacterium]|nr:NAD-dependent epimerase/dehydratase family protein [Verrucomicrobiota bacterium]
MSHNLKTILVTGGAGYIGSHTCVALCEAGYTPVIFDDFCNSSISVVKKIETLAR